MGDLIGIQPDYVFVTRFPFFEDMVDDIGGIEVRNPRRFSDQYLKPKGFQAGKIHLGGYDAMAFSRIRKTLAGGDFDRSANQQRALRGIHARIRARADVPGFMERGVMTVMKHLSHRPAAHRALPARPGDRPGRGPARSPPAWSAAASGPTAARAWSSRTCAQARRSGGATRRDATLEGLLDEDERSQRG